MAFELPSLPYDYTALEPFIDEETMKLHHDKHHQAYVDKLNAALEDHPELQERSIEELLRNIDQIPDEIRQSVKNHGGGHFNHSFFWETLGKTDSQEPTGKIKEEIEKVWGSFDKFKEEFTKSATTLFGSGWTWLAADENGENLHIHNHPLQENPLMHKHIPILGLDLWEHSYYLKYQNRRPEYIQAWWSVINWEKVNDLFEKVGK
jgi:superoxide dismutase, Fe-Mn family